MKEADVNAAISDFLPAEVIDLKREDTRLRLYQARAIAEGIIEYLKAEAEVVVPDHPVSLTQASGGPVHTHTNRTIKHHNGIII